MHIFKSGYTEFAKFYIEPTFCLETSTFFLFNASCYIVTKDSHCHWRVELDFAFSWISLSLSVGQLKDKADSH
jgi:hypothetical protein